MGAVRSSPVFSIAIEAAKGAARNTRKELRHGNHWHFHLHRQRLQRTLALNVKARIARIEHPSDKGPHFRIYAGNVDYAENVIMWSAGR
ncbi:hypothetical protein D9M68_235850 [compost metagenome]